MRDFEAGMIGSVGDLVRPDEGLVNRRIFVDPDVYEVELERIFARCWLFLAHETQLAAARATSSPPPWARTRCW